MARIIAGSAKGRRIAAPKGDRTRPTTDRVREALFSALASWFDTTDGDPAEQLAGLSVLDLCAGSGAIALEAASRGAARVVAVEHDRQTAALIEANAKDARLRVEVRAARAEQFAGAAGEAFDLVFLDPPYEAEIVDDVLTALVTHGRLAPRALVVVERSARGAAPVWPAVFTDVWERGYGETVLYFGATD
ncbi:16S rRNA (guanine(966)-N(2))-methyltransferase RsmD [Tessaracoccus caeni]|uniref:16S rRNA (guanine(966)-N(2))-methyltransferase RsmD n=1 Tax=Tessaracoccus caeni TaxID=3031239 RepID=UPI0023DCB524|nr:16S rRNA (guanine(966)-N(2))-methyltransferase RsmD [Tessaracoccus caeni]MDF1490273.1 16S rRNA (guanine(966)-N(2))-methyltransferase RsmD [Tessaracoccus caeni]